MALHYNVTEIGGSWYVVYPNGARYNGDNCTLAVCPLDLSIYGYRPTLPGSAAVIALYGICAAIQILLGFRYKTWGFMTAMLFGCISEALGYAGRILMWKNPWNYSGFIMQIVLITIGPVFFSGAIYFMLSRIINLINPHVARFKPSLIFWIFISCDIIALVLQAVGGAMSSESKGKDQSGVDIALAGLVFQVVTLALFSVLVADYAWLARRTVAENGVSTRFKIFAVALTVALVTILTRCCYRVYELSGGYKSSNQALRRQPVFNGLEMSMIIIAAYALIVAHPGFVFGRDDGRTEEVEKGKQRLRHKSPHAFVVSSDTSPE